MQEIKLKSGATLKFGLAPFTEAKDLYQAVLKELKTVEIDETKPSQANMIKNLVCVGFSSREIESALVKCLSRCLYNGTKITSDTWEDERAREDYFEVQIEVIKGNIAPFVKSLSAELSSVYQTILGDLKSNTPTTQT